ncbi:MAG: hypothetical protein M1827_003016 [Pycnora praestabilis]|nr:MAG: hypothetical protein M1827_003016 [Pycnora praestabilis]
MAPGRSTTGRGLASVTPPIRQEEQEDVDESSKEYDGHQLSQGEDTKLDAMMESLANSSRKRHEAKRKAIEREHAARIAKAQKSINSLYETHELERQRYRKCQLARLATLLKRRKSIEAKILANIQVFEATLQETFEEVTTITTGRVQDLG